MLYGDDPVLATAITGENPYLLDEHFGVDRRLRQLRLHFRQSLLLDFTG